MTQSSGIFRAKRPGFTLIELLVVIVLMGVATTIGVVMFSKIFDAWGEVKTRSELEASAVKVFDSFRKDLMGVISAKLSGESITGARQTAHDNRFFKIGLDDDQIIMPVEIVAGPEGRLQRLDVKYSIERKKDGGCALVRTASAPGAKSSAPIEIAGGVLAMCIEYIGREPDAQWVRDWTKNESPAAVRVSLTLTDPYKPFEQISRKAVFPIKVD
jgi:prepilin-type N-terminal cleavage/methylation domain-containing protein